MNNMVRISWYLVAPPGKDYVHDGSIADQPKSCKAARSTFHILPAKSNIWFILQENFNDLLVTVLVM